MAEAENNHILFEDIELEIIQTIDMLIDSLKERKTKLLKDLEVIREKRCIQSLESAMSIAELRQFRDKIRRNSEKSNTIMKINDTTLQNISTEIKELNDFVAQAKLHFAHRVDEIKLCIENMEIVETNLDITGVKPPISCFGKEGRREGKFNFPVRLVVDEAADRVLVVDRHNSRVQVFSMMGQFLDTFGSKQLKHPMGIALGKRAVFVTDSNNHCVFKYDRRDYGFMKSAGGIGSVEGLLDYPTCVESHENGNLYVGELNNWRVSVFSSDLKPRSTLCKRKCQPTQLRLLPEFFLVLSTTPLGIFMFSYGDLLLQKLPVPIQQTSDVSGYNICHSFFISKDRLLFIPNIPGDCIDVRTMDGNLVERFGKRGKGRGEICVPFDVCVTDQGSIIIASGNPNFAVQIY